MRKSAFFAALVVGFVAVVLSVPAQGQRGRGPVTLPDGPGRAMVEMTCSQCHGLNMITNSWGNDEAGWRELFGSMIELPDDQASAIAGYLAATFPVRPAPEGVVVPGDVEVTITEWVVPTLGSRPHDPMAARDGSIWWTGQFASRLGRLDPATGRMREYPLPVDNSGPHGLVEDAEGMVYYTGINQNYIGKLDPATGDVTQYPFSDAVSAPDGARGPHTPILDQRGNLWFSVQSGAVGRLITETGEMQIVPTPSDNTYPYGMVVDSHGVIWYADFRGNRLGSVDPATMQITEHGLPNADARPRRIAITPDDVIYYTDFARGYLGMFNPATGEIREWASPSGPESQPYGITAVGDIIWYSESGVRGNTLVRFDTTTEQFQSWLIPSGGGVVRNMMATADGNLVLACSGVNRVALVEVGD